MCRRLTLAAAAALLLASVCVVPVNSSAQTLPKESESPINDQGSNYNYRSYISTITPRVPGLQLEVLEFADRLVLRNHTGKTVTIYGYEGEPYARVLANGTAEQNMSSPASYLNTNFYGEVTVPPSASPNAPAKWKVIDRTGQFEWHDHRIHWMSPVPPASVKDKSKRTKIFNWSVPIAVGAKKGAVDGQLFWVPENSKTPVAAIVALIVLVALSLAFVLFVRRRRSGAQPAHADPDEAGRREAW